MDCLFYAGKILPVFETYICCVVLRKIQNLNLIK